MFGELWRLKELRAGARDRGSWAWAGRHAPPCAPSAASRTTLPHAPRRTLALPCRPQALGQALLYRYERKQFDELGALPGCEGRPVDEVYGAEHLLRLLVKLPAFLEATAMDADQRLVLQAKLQELLKFLQKNQALYFGAKHVSPPKEYLEWWEAHETAGGADAPGGKGAAAQAAADGSGKAPAGAAPRNANGARSQ